MSANNDWVFPLLGGVDDKQKKDLTALMEGKNYDLVIEMFEEKLEKANLWIKDQMRKKSHPGKRILLSKAFKRQYELREGWNKLVKLSKNIPPEEIPEGRLPLVIEEAEEIFK